MLQRKQNCACGGGCPRCSQEVNAETIQTKLAVSTPGDQYEQEADRVADQVMRMSEPQSNHDLRGLSKSPGSLVQRNCALSVEEEEALQRKEISGGPTVIEKSHDAPAEVHEALHSPGVSLDAATRAFMEPRFGRALDDVRVHTGSQAATAAKGVGALAFTVGHNIVFGNGQFAPDTSNGRRLLAHELAHVVQQKGSVSRSIQRDVDPAIVEESERLGQDFRRDRIRDLGRMIDRMQFRKIVVDCLSNTGVRLLDVLSRMRSRVNANPACLRFFQQNFRLSPDSLFLPNRNPTITVDAGLTVSGRTRCPEPAVLVQGALCGSPLRERVIMHELTHYAGCLTSTNTPSSEALAEQGADVCMGTVREALDAARQVAPTAAPQPPQQGTHPVQRKVIHDEP